MKREIQEVNLIGRLLSLNLFNILISIKEVHLITIALCDTIGVDSYICI